MQNLINQLSHPQLQADGSHKPTTALMRRAAETLSVLNNMRIADTDSRIKSETELIATIDALNVLRELKEKDWSEEYYKQMELAHESD